MPNARHLTMSEQEESLEANIQALKQSIKSEPVENKVSDVFYDSVERIKQELHSLYEDHEVKEEIVIGPTQIQYPLSSTSDNDGYPNQQIGQWSPVKKEIPYTDSDREYQPTAELAEEEHNPSTSSAPNQTSEVPSQKPTFSRTTKNVLAIKGPPKKKPRLEPPSKKTEGDTTKTEPEIQEAPLEELSVAAPVTAKVEDPKKPESGKAKKRKAKSKPTDAITIKKYLSKAEISSNDQDSVILEEAKKNKGQSKKNKPKTVTPKAINIANSKISESPKTSQSDNPTLADDNTNFICNYCENQFDTKQSLIQHLITSHNSVKDAYFRCKQCPYNTFSKATMNKHMKLHDKKRKYGCNLCNSRLATKSTLKSHVVTKHISNIHSCDICEYKTNFLCNLDSHLRKHAGLVVDGQEPNASDTVPFKSTGNVKERPFTCNVCNHRSKTSGNFKQHMKTHNNEKAYSCDICDYKCNYICSLKDHMRKHTGDYYTCHLCSYKTINGVHLKQHMTTHTGEKPYACNACSYKTTASCDLKRHLRTHTGEKPFACNSCSYKATESSHLINHMRTHTGEKPFACNSCSYKTSRRSDLKRHMRTHTGEKPYACNSCSYKATDSSNLKRHLSTHTGDKPFACNSCSFKTTRGCDLKKHMRTHTGDKPFTCNLCSYKATQSSNLINHMRAHTGEKPYACNSCSYKTSQSSNLKSHVRIHTGDKPYSCNACSYKTTRGSDLKTHMRTHTGDKPFACNACSYKTTQSIALKRHMRTHTDR